MRVKYLIFLIGAIAPLMLCEVRSAQAENLIKPTLKTSLQPATTVDEWLAQIDQAAVAQITAVQLNPTTTGVEVILETVGQLEPTTSVVGDALIIDVPNSVLTSVATGEEHSRGFEFDLKGEILPGWNLIASYSNINAEVTEDNTISVGNELPGVPRNSANLWTTYEIQSGDLEGLGFGIGFNFAGERAGDRENTFEVDSYLLTNAAVFYRRDNWRAALNFRNIFDVEYIQGTPVSRTSSIEPGRPFTVVGSVSVQF